MLLFALFIIVQAALPPGQAVVVAEKHHHAIVLLFALGYLLHAALEIDKIARANPPTTGFKAWLAARAQIFLQNWIRLAARFFISVCLFLYLWHNPAAVPSLLASLGVTLGTTGTAILTLPIVPPIAGIFGFFADSLLGYLPFLKNALPPVDGPDAPAAKAKQA